MLHEENTHPPSTLPAPTLLPPAANAALCTGMSSMNQLATRLLLQGGQGAGRQGHAREPTVHATMTSTTAASSAAALLSPPLT